MQENRWIYGAGDSLRAAGTLLALALMALPACSFGGPDPTALAEQIREMRTAVDSLDAQLTMQEESQKSERLQAKDAVAKKPKEDEEKAPRFTLLPAGKLTIEKDEFESLKEKARSVAALPADRGFDVILDYCQSASSQVQAIKLLKVMDSESANKIMALFRPAELRAFLDQTVKIAGQKGNTTTSYDFSPEATTAQVGRFQLVEGSWRTIFDTATGVTWNYRHNPNATTPTKEVWEPITPPIFPKKK